LSIDTTPGYRSQNDGIPKGLWRPSFFISRRAVLNGESNFESRGFTDGY
jgi:hypothetical protein